MIKQLGLALAIVFASGCSILPQPEIITSYKLAQPEVAPAEKALQATLRINKPQASGLMTTTRILVEAKEQELTLYSGAQWHETAPILVQNYLFDAFNQAEIIDFVYKDSSYLIKTQYELDSDLRAFQALSQDGKNLVKISLAVRLVDSKPKRIIAAKVFTQEIAITSLEISQLVAGFSQAQNLLTQEILAWTKNTLQVGGEYFIKSL